MVAGILKFLNVIGRNAMLLQDFEGPELDNL
jgi:hypothetical protein